MKRIAILTGLVAILAASLSAWFLVPGFGASASDTPCSMDASQPTHGYLQLEYLRPSTDNPDRNDYKLSGSVAWDDQHVLDCFDTGRVDWAYEHNITYGQWFDRKIWGQDFSEFDQTDAGPYTDTTVSDHGDHTDLSFGIFRPERLQAGKEYHFSYDVFLPNNPQDGKQWIELEGQVLEKQCSEVGPWCVGLNSPIKGSSTGPLVGWTRGFSVTGTTCWQWRTGQSPVDCSPPAPAAPATSAPAQLAPPAQPVAPQSEAPNPPPVQNPVPAPTVAAPPAPAQPTTAQGTVNGCNTYGQNCDGDPIYTSVPQPGYDWRSEPKIATVPNGTVLTARCWAPGGRTYNWAVSQNDPGPNPYDSDVYFSVQAPNGAWGFIPDTYFVHDQNGHLGLPAC